MCVRAHVCVVCACVCVWGGTLDSLQLYVYSRWTPVEWCACGVSRRAIVRLVACPRAFAWRGAERCLGMPGSIISESIARWCGAIDAVISTPGTAAWSTMENTSAEEASTKCTRRRGDEGGDEGGGNTPNEDEDEEEVLERAQSLAAAVSSISHPRIRLIQGEHAGAHAGVRRHAR